MNIITVHAFTLPPPVVDEIEENNLRLNTFSLYGHINIVLEPDPRHGGHKFTIFVEGF